MLVLGLVTAACLLPFVGRPLNIDDPMYVWAAEQIRAHPLDFYGFPVVWTDADLPMFVQMQNPPLASYYIALASLIGGFGEVALHVAFLLPALGLILGTYQLARQMCRWPALAALLTITTPVFVICANTITCDVLMACFWVWAIVLWDRGLRLSHWPSALGSALLIGAACMTKYPGVNLIPLLAVYSIARGVSWRWLLFLLVPLGIVWAFDLLTHHLYGRRLFSEAFLYAHAARAGRQTEPLFNSFVALCFTGGCMLPALLLAPMLWRRRSLALGVVIGAIVLVVLVTNEPRMIPQLRVDGVFNWPLALQVALWAPVGLGILVATIADLWRRRNAESVLLTSWIFGTFAFAGIVNWAVNGRSLLPMAPAVAIVLVRRMEAMKSLEWAWQRKLLPAAIGVSAAVCLMLATADARLASSARRAAELIAAKYGQTGVNLWFHGNWGFQYYMQQLGGQPCLTRDPRIDRGDIVVVPMYNLSPRRIGKAFAEQVDNIVVSSFPWASTMNVSTGAGFYSNGVGPVPFVIGPAPQEQYFILRMKQPFQ